MQDGIEDCIFKREGLLELHKSRPSDELELGEIGSHSEHKIMNDV